MSVCCLPDNENEAEHCRVKVKGKNPTNLKQHLMRHHKNKYQKEEEIRSHKTAAVTALPCSEPNGQLAMRFYLV